MARSTDLSLISSRHPHCAVRPRRGKTSASLGGAEIRPRPLRQKDASSSGRAFPYRPMESSATMGLRPRVSAATGGPVESIGSRTDPRCRLTRTYSFIINRESASHRSRESRLSSKVERLAFRPTQLVSRRTLSERSTEPNPRPLVLPPRTSRKSRSVHRSRRRVPQPARCTW